MQAIESFTAITTIIDARQRLAHYDALRGLTIEGLGPHEAKLVLLALEALDQPALVAIAQGQRVGPVQAPPTPTQPANRAQWQPAQPKPEDPPAEPVASEPGKATSAPAGAFEVPEGGQGTPEPTKPPTVAPSNTSAYPAKPPADQGAERASTDVHELGGDVELLNVPSVQATEPPEDKPRKPKHTGPLKPPPKPGEIRPDQRGAPAAPKPPKKKPVDVSVGDTFDDATVADVITHKDGGRLLVLDNGWRVKLDARGKEVARVEGLPPGSDEEAGTQSGEEMAATAAALGVTAEELEAVQLDTPLDAPPANVMQSRMTREVIQWVLDQHGGAADKEVIMAACLDLKSKGALAFEASKDEEAVRRRVNSSLTVMGLR